MEAEAGAVWQDRTRGEREGQQVGYVLNPRDTDQSSLDHRELGLVRGRLSKRAPERLGRLTSIKTRPSPAVSQRDAKLMFISILHQHAH